MSRNQENYIKETTSQTVGGLFKTFHIVTFMESYDWLMKYSWMCIKTDNTAECFQKRQSAAQYNS